TCALPISRGRPRPTSNWLGTCSGGRLLRCRAKAVAGLAEPAPHPNREGSGAPPTTRGDRSRAALLWLSQDRDDCAPIQRSRAVLLGREHCGGRVVERDPVAPERPAGREQALPDRAEQLG